MKRYVHANYSWNVSEPSAYEYGKALSQGNKRINERFAPFELHDNVHFFSGLANSVGYRISLSVPGDSYYEWIAYNKNATRFESAIYVLYGPANTPIKNFTQMSKLPNLGEFKSLDSVMSFMFEEYDNLLEQIEDADSDLYDEDDIEIDINKPVPADHVPGQSNSNEVMCPTCNSIFRKAPRCPECGQLLDYTGW